MKKLLCIILSIILVVSSSAYVVFADKGGGNDKGKGQWEWVASKDKQNKDKGQNESVDTEDVNKTAITTDADADSVKAQLKQYYKDKNKRNQLIKKLKELRNETKLLEKKLIFLKGVEVESDVAPVIKYGRMLMPIRAITTALGADVKWNPETHVVTITKDATVIEITLGSNIVKVNGVEVKIDTPAEMTNNRIIVPVRFIAETFRQKVEWDEETGSVIIEDDNGTTPTPAPTATPTATATPIPTATATPTATPIPTVTPAATPVPTVTPTATPVPTIEPTATPTATPVPTAAPTATPTPMPTPEPTATP